MLSYLSVKHILSLHAAYFLITSDNVQSLSIGAYIHTEVLSHKTMSVIRHTANQIALNDRLHSGTCITVRAKVSMCG